MTILVAVATFLVAVAVLSAVGIGVGIYVFVGEAAHSERAGESATRHPSGTGDRPPG